MPKIEIDGLTAHYESRCVLRSVSLEILHGELFFLIGPSGCGKTTLLRLIAGFLTPTSGVIRFDGEEITRLSPHLRETAMVFQSYALWPHMTVAENVAFGLETRKLAKAEIPELVEKALDSVHLPGSGSRRVGELSGGQQQRVALARALVVRPRCLLLDEPLSNLDAGLRREMRFEIRKICKDHGLTGVYVTHDQEEALSMADRLAVMSEGSIQQVGTPSAVYRNPVNREVAEFMGETNVIDAHIEEMQDQQRKLCIRLGSASYTLDIPEQIRWSSDAKKLRVSIRPEAFTLSSCKGEAPCLAGEVVEVSYLGSILALRVAIEGQGILKVIIMNPQEPLLESGVRLELMISKSDIVPLGFL